MKLPDMARPITNPTIIENLVPVDDRLLRNVYDKGEWIFCKHTGFHEYYQHTNQTASWRHLSLDRKFHTWYVERQFVPKLYELFYA